ncbi:unnamed protein product, partial [Ascophyllum nodosum]
PNRFCCFQYYTALDSPSIMVSLGGQSIVQAFALRVSSVRLEQQYQGARLSCCSSDSVVTSACDWTDVRPFVPPQRYRSTSPADSLKKGEWFKLICGASFEDLPAVRNLALVYTLSGADCIDVAAEEAVIEAARDGIVAAQRVADAIGAPVRAPWLMTSVNDDEEDPHFRKAFFDPSLCPSVDCPRPCERVCPVDAVVFPDSAAPPAQRADMVATLLSTSPGGGVLGPRCYGCGRCIDVCPPGIIRAKKYRRSPQVIRGLLKTVEAVEIHTKGDIRRFQYLWEESIAAAASDSLKLVAVSFPDLGSNMGLTLAAMNAIMGLDGASAKAVSKSEATHSGGGSGQYGVDVETVGGAGQALNVWQTDGRPMSGDIGTGATVACVRLAEKVLTSRVLPFGEGQHFVQLAGGTNARTAPKLRELGLLRDSPQASSFPGVPGISADTLTDRPIDPPASALLSVLPMDFFRNLGQGRSGQHGRGGVAGIAYGGFARKAVGRVLDRLPETARVEDHPQVLVAAVEEASLLVRGLKRP